MRFDLSDEEWALLDPLMPRSRRCARVDDRKIMNAIFYVLRTGCRGGIYRSAMVPTRQPTIASTAGPDAASGRRFSTLWRRNRATVFI